MQIATEGQRGIKGHGRGIRCVWVGVCVCVRVCVGVCELACLVEVFQVTAPCFYGYSVSNDSPDVLPFLWFRCSASITMKEKKGVYACVCVCVRVCGSRTCADGRRGSRGSYILSQRPAGANLEPRGQGYFIFPKHKPQAPRTHTHTHTHPHNHTRVQKKQCLARSYSL